VIDAERLVINKKLADVKGDNTNMDREISRNKMFNKKDEEKKARKAEHDKLADRIKDQNKIIEENDIALDKEKNTRGQGLGQEVDNHRQWTHLRARQGSY
jgi:hypothetical protein